MNHAMNSMNCNARIFGVTERMIEGGDLPPNAYIDTLKLAHMVHGEYEIASSLNKNKMNNITDG